MMFNRQKEPSQNKIIIIDENSIDNQVQNILKREQISYPSQPIQEYSFQLPYSRTHQIVVLSVEYLTEQITKLNSCNKNTIQQQINQYSTLVKDNQLANFLLFSKKCESKDAQVWSIQIFLEVVNDNMMQFYFDFRPNGPLDDSKCYKFQSTVATLSYIKRKEIRIAIDEKKKSGSTSIPLQFANLGEGPVGLTIEIAIETSSKYSSRDEVGYTGLINNSSLCYMNSVFQILFNISEFRRLLFQIEIVNEEDQKEFPATVLFNFIQNYKLQTLFYSLMTQRKTVSTQEIIKSFKWDSEAQSVQHDVQEFTMELLKGIQSRLEKNNSELASEINSLFEGQLENHLKITFNGVDRVSSESFLDISLNVEGFSSLTESFQSFTSHELMSGENALQTDEWGPQEALKFHQFSKLPPVLWINLKRYRYNSERGGFEKINDRFEFPENIDLSPYLTQSSQQNNNRFTLFAVLVHRGELIHHGHYYCFIRPQGDEWLKFDDRVVTRATYQQVYENNFGGQFEAGEFDRQLGTVVTAINPSPETAYMLVYVRESQFINILKPINEEDMPNWIKQREAINNKKLEQKNFIQVFQKQFIIQRSAQSPILPLINFQQMKHHSEMAPNSQIDINELEANVEKNTIQLYIPKNYTTLQIFQQLSQIFEVDQDSLYLYFYKISCVKPDQEQIQQILPSSKKQFNQYTNQKLLYRSLICFSKSIINQSILEKKYTQIQAQSNQIELPDTKGLGSKRGDNILSIIQLDDIESQEYLIFLKEFRPPGLIEFQSSIIMNGDSSIQQLMNEVYERVKIYQPHYKLEFYFLENFKVIEHLDNSLKISELINQSKIAYLTVLVQLSNNNEKGVSAIQWAQSVANMREVILRNQSTQQESKHIFKATDTSYEILKEICNIEQIERDHVILKYKEKKGFFVQLKQPDIVIDLEQESDQTPMFPQKNKKNQQVLQTQQIDSIDNLIKYDSIILYKYSAVSVYDLGKQFAVSYEIQLWNGDIISFNDIICSKEFLLNDLIEQEIKSRNMLQLMIENGGNKECIVPLLVRKKNLGEIIVAQECKFSLSKLKGSYLITFLNKFVPKQIDGIPITVLYRAMTAEMMTFALIVIETEIQTTFQDLAIIGASLLSNRTISYCDETFSISENEITITNPEGKIRKAIMNFEIFYAYADYESSLPKEEFNKTIQEAIQSQDNIGIMDLSVQFQNIQDTKSQRLRQQGVKLNL